MNLDTDPRTIASRLSVGQRRTIKALDRDSCILGRAGHQPPRSHGSPRIRPQLARSVRAGGAAVTAPKRYEALIDRHARRRDEIARLDAVSRSRALTEQESVRLGHLIYRDRYVAHRKERRMS